MGSFFDQQLYIGSILYLLLHQMFSAPAMGKACFLVTLLFFWGFHGFSQFEYFGSPPDLKQHLQNDKQDTTRLRLYVRLSNRYVYSHPDTAFQYAQDGLSLARRITDQKWIAYNSLSLAQSFIVMGNFPTAIEVALGALPIFEKQKDTTGLIFSNLISSWAQREAGDAKRAMPFAKRAKDYATNANDLFSLLIACEHLIGEYRQLNQLDSALHYGKLVLKLQDVVQSPWQGFYRTIAMVYFENKQYSLALQYYRMTIVPSLEAGILFDVLDVYTGIAQVYRRMGDLDSSTFYGYRALHEHTGVPKLDTRLKAASLLAENYQQYKILDSALKYTKLSMALKDSLPSQEKVKAIQNVFLTEQFRQQQLQQQRTVYNNQVRTYVLIGGLVALLAIAGLLYRNNQHKQKAYDLVQLQKRETEKAYDQLKATQAQLIQKEKMASLGELTAGIAHEIQNPLNFVNNFSAVNGELLSELQQEAKAVNMEEVISLAETIEQNEAKISYHGKKADSIVKGMLQHSRGATGERLPTNINALVAEYLRLAYHGYRVKDHSFNADLTTHYDPRVGEIDIVPQDIGRVLINLFSNAFYSVTENKKLLNGALKPVISVNTEKDGNSIRITVKDNGMGMPPKVAEKVFQPFFTTKPTGEGTGLGLSLSYDIIKAHRGELKVETEEGEGALFIVILQTSY